MRLRYELFVDDLEATIDFYCAALGFEVERRSQGYVAIVNGDVRVGLGPISKLPAEPTVGFSQASVRAGRGAGIELVFETPSLDEDFARAQRHGATIVAGLTRQAWGLRDFRILDPEGYYLRITEPDR